jgi:hypothetical protein
MSELSKPLRYLIAPERPPAYKDDIVKWAVRQCNCHPASRPSNATCTRRILPSTPTRRDLP